MKTLDITTMMVQALKHLPGLTVVGRWFVPVDQQVHLVFYITVKNKHLQVLKLTYKIDDVLHS